MCAHYIPGVASQSGEPECTQMPNVEIPPEVWNSEVKHFEPMWGEKKAFRPKEGVTDEMVESWIEMFDAMHSQITGEQLEVEGDYPFGEPDEEEPDDTPDPLSFAGEEVMEPGELPA